MIIPNKWRGGIYVNLPRSTAHIITSARLAELNFYVAMCSNFVINGPWDRAMKGLKWRMVKQ